MTMQTIAFSNIYEELSSNNYLFENDNAPIGDNLLRPFAKLRSVADSLSILVGTVDILKPEQINAYVFIDMPSVENRYFVQALNSGKDLYLLALESPLIRPDNYNKELHRYFKKIFTWNDGLVDGEKYIKINYSFEFPLSIQKDLSRKKKCCVMIACNKRSSSPHELYSERRRTIRWFEKEHPEDLDLYGIGWEREFSGFRMWFRRILDRGSRHDSRPSLYQGKVERKRPILEQYRFAICYENIKDIQGYITEKIFDCFFAGCVPIYWGASNIADHIPKECFIDRRQFKDVGSVFKYIKNMEDKRYMSYLDCIDGYLHSPESYSFTTEYFARTILKEIAC